MSAVIVYYKTRKQRFFQLPAELDDVAGDRLPLYIFVALWALRRNCPVTVKDVRAAFGLSLRRASDILEYITERGEGVVEASCILRPLTHGDRRKRREWNITAVYGELLRTSKAIPDGTGSKSSTEQEDHSHADIQELRRWFIQRRPGKIVPDDLIQK